jgi:hypothetical protein
MPQSGRCTIPGRLIESENEIDFVTAGRLTLWQRSVRRGFRTATIWRLARRGEWARGRIGVAHGRRRSR